MSLFRLKVTFFRAGLPGHVLVRIGCLDLRSAINKVGVRIMREIDEQLHIEKDQQLSLGIRTPEAVSTPSLHGRGKHSAHFPLIFALRWSDL